MTNQSSQVDNPKFLILRVTNRCNFKCTYCATNASKGDKTRDMTPEQAIEYISMYKQVAHIQFEGGEPLLVGPRWYEQVLDYIDVNYPNANVTMTSNLWDFYKRPEKWASVLARFDAISTSFDDTNERKLSDDIIIDRQRFKQIVDTYYKYIPKQQNNPELSVLSLMNDDNIDRWNDIINFLQIQCRTNVKFNGVRAIGRSTYHTPKIKMLKLWANILKYGYDESYCEGIYNYIINNIPYSGCPFDINCDKKFVVINSSGPVATCAHYYDHINGNINAQKNVIPIISNRIPSRKVIFPEKCFTCKCFSICNGCRIDTDQILKDYPTEQQKQQFCTEVQQTYQEIEKYAKHRHDFINSKQL